MKPTPSIALQTSAIAAASKTEEAVEVTPAPPVAVEEPTTGGTFLRDPVTGALTPVTSKE